MMTAGACVYTVEPAICSSIILQSCHLIHNDFTITSNNVLPPTKTRLGLIKPNLRFPQVTFTLQSALHTDL